MRKHNLPRMQQHNLISLGTIIFLSLTVLAHAYLGESETQNNIEYGTSNKYGQLAGMPCTIHQVGEYIILISYNADKLADYIMIQKKASQTTGKHYLPNQFTNEELATFLKYNLGDDAQEGPVASSQQDTERVWVSKDKTRFAFLNHVLANYENTQDSFSVQLLFLCTYAGIVRSEQLSKENGSSKTTYSTEGE